MQSSKGDLRRRCTMVLEVLSQVKVLSCHPRADNDFTSLLRSSRQCCNKSATLTTLNEIFQANFKDFEFPSFFYDIQVIKPAFLSQTSFSRIFKGHRHSASLSVQVSDWMAPVYQCANTFHCLSPEIHPLSLSPARQHRFSELLLIRSHWPCLKIKSAFRIYFLHCATTQRLLMRHQKQTRK